MNIQQIGGYQMHLAGNPQAAYWRLKGFLEALLHAVTQRECDENNDASAATAADLMAADAIIDYSYGGATEKRCLGLLADAIASSGKRWRLLISIAKVPDVAYGQLGGLFGGLWHVEECFDRAVFFNIDVLPPSPISHSIKNAGAVGMTIAEFAAALAGGQWKQADGSLAAAMPRLINVDCDSLVAGLDEVSKHTTVCNQDALVGPQGAIVGIFKALAAADAPAVENGGLQAAGGES